MADYTFCNYLATGVIKHTVLKAIEENVSLSTHWVVCPGCSETFPSHIRHYASAAEASGYRF